MGRITQLAGESPQVLKDDLENKKVSVNQGWKILQAVQRMTPERQKSAAEKMLAAVYEIDRTGVRSVNAGIARAEDVKRGPFLLDQAYELMYQAAKNSPCRFCCHIDWPQR